MTNSTGKARRWVRWSPEEHDLVTRGIVPEGRSVNSCRAYAFQHGIRFTLASSRRREWLDSEIDLLRQGIVPEGRTLMASRFRAYLMGISFRPASHPEPRWKADGRAEAMWVLSGRGFTYSKIGEWFGVSKERVRQLIGRYTDWLENCGGEK